MRQALDEHPSDEQLLAYLEREFTNAQAEDLKEHLEACEKCGERLEQLWANDSFVRQHQGAESSQQRNGPEHHSQAEHPQRIGRYRVQRVLGQGGFGCVYLAWDEELDRPVAIKAPRRERISQPEDVEAYLAEARVLASLDHPHIVPVHDVGRTEDGLCYVVSKFIDGSDLRKKIDQQRPSYQQTAEWIAAVAKALHYAHKKGLVHRDIKPGNLLLDSAGKPYVADFGLALKEQEFGTGACWTGTPAYMSPEQARGEGHRVDGRSDIFSLGVVFCELLAGNHPFRGESSTELLQQIKTVEVRLPQQGDDSIPKELERICLKALSKRATDRYTTALDMAEDLRHFLAHKSQAKPVEKQPVKVVPKGLRSFDEHDADFFLELLPGPRDRDGLPESLRFWKTRIEEMDGDCTFTVGLICGPSGCGKSSLLKAGLLPRLADHVVSIYVESTAGETETRLLKGLRKHCPNLPDDLGLTETLAALRRGGGAAAGKKVLLVVDQFEQWLHAKREEEDAELVQALRHCDGGCVQGLVLVRVDFWMAATRFMRELEIRLVEGRNSAAVDLFDPLHARKVLGEFGRAFGRLPDNLGELAPDQQGFLEQAVLGLSEEGKVISVRLALFGEMVKSKPWTPATLKEVGGAEGVGVAFLEETFSAATAPPELRRRQNAARGVLKALLPERGADIKGPMRSYQKLLEASGYGRRRKEFDDLLGILDSEIRLITPTDPEGVETGEDAPPETAPAEKYYQLTHDYLMPSLRRWLTRKQKETRRGRAELRLAERTAIWSAKPENRHLPAWWEYLNIRWFTSKKDWTAPQRKMMLKAARCYLTRWGSGLVILLLAGLMLGQYLASVHEKTNQDRTNSLIKTVLIAPAEAVPFTVKDLRPLKKYALPQLRQILHDSTREDRHRLHAALALADLGEVPEDFLIGAIATCPDKESGNILTALRQVEASARDKLLARIQDEADSKTKVRLATMLLNLQDARSAQQILQLAPDPILRTNFIHQVFPSWHGDLSLLPDLLRNTHDSAFRSGICAALGALPVADLDAQERQGLREVLLELYRMAPDGATHSAAGWALRQWKIPLPRLESSTTPPMDRRWYVNSLGMTMVEIPAGEFAMGAGERKVPVTLTRPFYLSDREVTVDQFLQFIIDKEYPFHKPQNWLGYYKFASPTGDCPVQSVRWYHAIMFCNWLSWKEGHRPCYESQGKRKVRSFTGSQIEVDDWRLNRDADGYCLPTEAQWEYACRARSTTAFCFGNEEKPFLANYAVYFARTTEPCGSKLPNGWGLFDMHGNVWEWCQDWDVRYPPGGHDPVVLKGEGRRLLRGGGYDNLSIYCSLAGRHGHPPEGRKGHIGFRVAAVQSVAEPGK